MIDARAILSVLAILAATFAGLIFLLLFGVWLLWFVFGPVDDD